MRFVSPEWFLFLPAMVFLGWYHRRLQLGRPLRALCLVLLALVFVEPQIKRLAKGLDLWVLVDRSNSVRDALDVSLGEMEVLLRDSQGKHDRLFMVDYAEEAQVRTQSESLLFENRRGHTRTALAVRQAMAQRDPSRAAKVLVVTDGFATDDLADVEELLVRNRVPLDFRLAGGEGGIDYRVHTFEAPTRVQVTEPFILEVEVAGVPDAEVPYLIQRDNEVVQEGKVKVVEGIGRLRFTDRLTRAGSYRYTARVIPPEDGIEGNNAKGRWVEIVAGPRVLLVTSFQPDPVESVLAELGFSVEVVTDFDQLGPGRLSGVRAVIVNNVPAHILPPEFLPALDFFVRGQGGGIAMVGGNHSFGSGGYFRSAIDELLPVSMELRQEHRKLAVAMGIVMDRSGSMSMRVAGTGQSKMDLANTGATATVDLLGENDAITVFAVDSTAHEIVPLTQVGNARSSIQERTSRIVSTGGGIYVYTGLKAAWEELKKSEAGQRHIILFSDAADSEEPGDYKNLIQEMVDNDTTISVIGLGTESDSDADFLKDIAARGNGRIFFNTDPVQLPALFSQETVAVARSAFIEEVTGVKPTAGWLEIAAQPLGWLNHIDGYNLAYLRDGATAAAFTLDEYKAPLVAYWQRGAGRAAAVAFPLSGELAMLSRRWPDYGNFVQTLARWLMGEDTPPGIGFRTRVAGDRLDIDFLYDGSWEKKLAVNFPGILVSEGGMDEAVELTWQRLRPGHFRASTTLQAERPMRGAISVGETVLPFGPFMVGTDAEWQTDLARVHALRRLSAVSGGVERIKLDGVWEAPENRLYDSLRLPLLAAFLLAFVLEAFQTRTGIRWRQLLARRSQKEIDALSRGGDGGARGGGGGGDGDGGLPAPPAGEQPAAAAGRN